MNSQTELIYFLYVRFDSTQANDVHVSINDATKNYETETDWLDLLSEIGNQTLRRREVRAYSEQFYTHFARFMTFPIYQIVHISIRRVEIESQHCLLLGKGLSQLKHLEYFCLNVYSYAMGKRGHLPILQSLPTLLKLKDFQMKIDNGMELYLMGKWIFKQDKLEHIRLGRLTYGAEFKQLCSYYERLALRNTHRVYIVNMKPLPADLATYLRAICGLQMSNEPRFALW